MWLKCVQCGQIRDLSPIGKKPEDPILCVKCEGQQLMANMYEGGDADKRQDDTLEKPSRFRPRYRKLTEAELGLSDAIKAKAAELEALYSLAPQGRETSLALTKLEESVMWAVKAITA